MNYVEKFRQHRAKSISASFANTDENNQFTYDKVYNAKNNRTVTH